jgi:hypothetical protein
VKQAIATPDTAANAGESHTLASQMPGGSKDGYHEDFSNAHMYVFGGWTELDGVVDNRDSTYFDANKASSTDFKIWDKACTQ